MPQESLNCFSGTTVLPLKELRQFSTDWACSSVRRAVILTESNSTPRKEILCTGESLLFSQLTWSPNWLRCRSTRSLWSHNCSQDWARKSQSSSWGSWCPLPVTGQGRPLRSSWRHGETGRARMGGRCTAISDPRTQTAGTVCVAEGSKHESKRPSGRSDAFDHVPVHPILEREPAQGLVQDSQIQDWPKITALVGGSCDLMDSESDL